MPFLPLLCWQTEKVSWPLQSKISQLAIIIQSETHAHFCESNKFIVVGHVDMLLSLIFYHKFDN